ncbi:MAG: MoxR family ATPase [Planctomycetes bacterium]|nr:MoxR family ATPase [Planctomycetota bacterium]
MPEEPNPDEVAVIRRLAEIYKGLKEKVADVIVGQDRVVDEVLVSLLCGGHSLLIGVPGLAKTLLVKTLASLLALRFSRIQFTPDLMPADITGTDIIQEDPETRSRSLKFLKGPVFANIVLSDEINRAPPKTQAALLEAMQEHHVTTGGRTYPLDEPFLVLATQNPIEQEGTYPLPEAQLDRFMFAVKVDYPSEKEEVEIILRTTAEKLPNLQAMLSTDEIVAAQQAVRKIPVSEEVAAFAAKLARLTRPSDSAPPKVREYVRWGAGPRAGQYMVLAAKARGALKGRFFASSRDVAGASHAVLRHRLVLNFRAEADGIAPEEVVDDVLNAAGNPSEG